MDEESLIEELNRRTKFLEVATKAKLFGADELFEALKEFRRNPDSIIEKLKSMITPGPAIEGGIVIIADSSEIKYCPRCGAKLDVEELGKELLKDAERLEKLFELFKKKLRENPEVLSKVLDILLS